VGSTPTRLRHFDFRFWILDFGLGLNFVRMTEQEFKDRTKNIAVRVIRLIEFLPHSTASQIIAKQLLRSATSIGANYRAACRGKSPADVIHKLAIVEEEADESLYWLELLIESEIVAADKLKLLKSDINEIVAMTVASIKTMRMKQRPIQNPKSKIQNRNNA
jgi:four helix bundle protein